MYSEGATCSTGEKSQIAQRATVHVLHVIPALWIDAGGPTRSVSQLCAHLRGQGIDVTILAPYGASERVQTFLSKAGVELCTGRGGASAPGQRAQLPDTIRGLAGGIDLVHIHSVWNCASTLAARQSRRLRIPYVLAPRGMLHAHCVRHKKGRKRLHWLLFCKRTVAGAAAIHFLNDAEARGSSWIREVDTAAFVAPNGVDSAVFESTTRGRFRSRYPELDSRRYMLFLGRLHKIKHLDPQLRALKLLSQRFDDLMWVLVGPDGGEWTHIRSCAQAMGLEKRILWVGPMHGDDRFDAMADADVVVQTSFHECHSMTINEALAIGRPLVITKSCNFEEVRQCGAGLVVDSDPVRIAEAVQVILEQPTLAQEMAKAGKAFAADQLAWPKLAARVASVYQWLLERGPEPACVIK